MKRPVLTAALDKFKTCMFYDTKGIKKHPLQTDLYKEDQHASKGHCCYSSQQAKYSSSCVQPPLNIMSQPECLIVFNYNVIFIKNSSILHTLSNHVCGKSSSLANYFKIASWSITSAPSGRYQAKGCVLFTFGLPGDCVIVIQELELVFFPTSYTNVCLNKGALVETTA